MKQKKHIKYFINSSVIVVGAVIVTILLNAILVNFDSKIPLEISLNRDEIYALTEESKKIADQIEKPTDIVVLYDGTSVINEQMMLLTNIIDLYTKRNDKITLKTIDYYSNPMELVMAYPEAVNSISDPRYAMIFVQGDKYDIAESASYISAGGKSNIERIITNKLATFADGFMFSEITLTTGHGEKLNEVFDGVLGMYDFDIQTVDLLKEDLPEDNQSLVVVNAPSDDFSQEEIEKLDSYLDRGGNVQIYFNPLLSNDTLPRLENYLKTEWAIERGHEVIVDMENKLESGGQTSETYGVLSVAKLTDSEIVAPITSSRRSVLYSAANPIRMSADKPAAVKITPVLTTSTGAYLKDVATINESKSGSDESGQFDILTVASKDNYTLNEEIFTGKLLVCGSSYAMDTLIGDSRYANEDLLMNTISWMRGSEAGITVREKELPTGSLTVPNSHFWPWFIALVAVVPVALIIGGIVVFIKRRYK